MSRNLKNPAWAILLLIATLYGLMEYWTPYMLDNLTFDSVYLDHNGASDNFSWRAWGAYIQELRTNDNWRLSNILAPVTTIFWPAKWWFAALTGLMVAAQVALSAAFASPRMKPSLTVLAWLAITVLIPWRNNLLVGDYALNYLYPGALLLAAIFLTSRGCKLWVPLLLCLLTAVWHEGFGATLGAALFGYAVFGRGDRRQRIGAGVLGLVTVAVTLGWAMNSYLVDRGTKEMHAPAAMAHTLKWLACNYGVILLWATLCAMTVFESGRQRLRQLWSSPAFVMLVMGTVGGMIVSGAVGYTPRVVYPAVICSVGAWMMLIEPVVESIRPGVRTVACWIIGLLLTAHGLYALKYIRLQSKEFAVVTEKLVASKNGTIYYDVMQPEDFPLLTLGYPMRSAFVDTYNYFALRNRYGRQFAVVPTALKGADPDSVSGYEVVEGLIVADSTVMPSSDPYLLDLRLRLRLQNGQEIEPQVAVFPFITAGGRTLYWLRPLRLPQGTIAEVKY